MSVSQINLNNNVPVQQIMPGKTSKSKAPAFKASGDARDVVLIRRGKPSLWDKYKGMIGGFVGFFGADALRKNLVTNPKYNWLWVPFAIGGVIVGGEAADRFL